MLENFIANLINFKINKIYTQNVKKLGFTAHGVFWNSKFNQTKRFRELLKFINCKKNEKLKIADIGCGYGALYEFLVQEKIINNFEYYGYDINKIFVDFCKSRFKGDIFFEGNKPNKIVDFCLMSGTYNFAIGNSIRLWNSYIINNIKECLNFSKIGIVFNIQFSNHECIVNSIYYSNPNNLKKKLQKLNLVVNVYDSNFFKRDKIFVLVKKS